MSIDELDVIEAIEVTIPEAWAEARAKEEAGGSGQRIVHPHHFFDIKKTNKTPNMKKEKYSCIGSSFYVVYSTHARPILQLAKVKRGF
jgi:hypothetical protein